MRTKNGFINVLASLSSNIVTIIIGLVAQALFIKIMGIEYLGLNGLFTNIISMLGIIELGIGSAIIYNLYKPIADKDIETIKSLIKFYKKSYHVIGFIVLTIGLIIIPFLPLIIEDVTVNINIPLVYILFLLEIVFSYFLSYKRSILYAEQKNYIINLIHIGYTVLLNAGQLLVLIFTKNYYLYLIIKIIARVIENLVITYIVNKKYSYLIGDAKSLDKKIESDIIKKVKALFFHKIASFVVAGTDNIIISKFLGVIWVGLYSNYFLVINAVQTLFIQALIALTPSVGNLLVTESKDVQFNTFKKVRFLNFWIACFSAIAVLIIMNSFITIWIGDEYLLSKLVLVVLIFNLFQKLMRSTYQIFKEAAGIYHEDRFVPLVESLINIIVSIIGVKLIGLAGVFIGTIVSGFALWLYSYPKYVYKKLFERDIKLYLKETIGYILLFVVVACVTYSINNIYIFANVYLEFIKNIIIVILVPNLIMLLTFIKNDNFIYYLNLFKKVIKK